MVAEEKLPGYQLATMTVDELVGDLGMSRIQAKRVKMNISGLTQVSNPQMSSAFAIAQVDELKSSEKSKEGYEQRRTDETMEANDGRVQQDEKGGMGDEPWDPVTAAGSGVSGGRG